MNRPPGETINYCTSDEWNAEVRDNPRPTAEYVMNFLHHEGLHCLSDGQWYYLNLEAGTPAGAIARAQGETPPRALPSLADLGNDIHVDCVEVTEPFNGERGLVSDNYGVKHANQCEWWELFVGYDVTEETWSVAEADFYTEKYISQFDKGRPPGFIRFHNRLMDEIAETLNRLKNKGEFEGSHEEFRNALAETAAYYHIDREFTRIFEEAGTHFLRLDKWTFLCTNLMRLMWIGQEGLRWIHKNALG